MTKQSHIEQLIHDLCPNGVEYKTLGELLDYEQPGKYIVKSTDYEDRFPTPVLTAGQSFILGYTDETDGIYKASKENPTLIFDDFTTSYHWVDFDFKVKSSAMKMLRPRKDVDVVFRYVYYAMLGIDYKPEEHTRQWISRYSVFEIPFPPFAVQKEIARILDSFANLINNIDAEISERQKQLEKMREYLFADLQSNCKEKKLEDVAEISRGVRVTKQDLTDGEQYFVYQNSLIPLGQYGKYNTLGNTPFVISAGSAGMVGYSESPYWAADDCLRIICKKELDSKYAYYYMLCKQNYFISNVRKGGVPRLSRTIVEQFPIPLPSLKEQQAIAAKLDTIEAFIANLNEERALRQQQYEYYRAKLISLLK